MTAAASLNKATMKTLRSVVAQASKSVDGWAYLGKFDIVHVGRLARAGLVRTDVVGSVPADHGFRWHVRPM